VSTISSILVGLTNKIVWVRVEGKGSFLNSGGVKDFAKEMINRGTGNSSSTCGTVRSWTRPSWETLAGIALRLRELGQGNLHVVGI